MASLRHPSKFQRVSRLGSVTARQSSSRRQPNFAVLNRGRHLYSAGRPSRWALAHISSCFMNLVRHTHRRQIEIDVDIWTSCNTWFIGPISSFIFYCLQTRSHLLGDNDFNWIGVINYVFITRLEAMLQPNIGFTLERSALLKPNSVTLAASKVGDQLRTS